MNTEMDSAHLTPQDAQRRAERLAAQQQEWHAYQRPGMYRSAAAVVCMAVVGLSLLGLLAVLAVVGAEVLGGL